MSNLIEIITTRIMCRLKEAGDIDVNDDVARDSLRYDVRQRVEKYFTTSHNIDRVLITYTLDSNEPVIHLLDPQGVESCLWLNEHGYVVSIT